MYQFLSLIGPGALSYLIIQFFMGEKNISFIEGIAQIISLSLINNLAVWLILMPFSKTLLQILFSILSHKILLKRI